MPAAVGEVPVSPAVAALERLETALHPARVDEVVAQATDDDLQLLYLQARMLGRLSWLTMAIVAGHALDRAEKGQLTVTAVAESFGVHKSEISRAAKVYRRIIKPRLEAQGADARFTIDGRTYYEVAIEAADHSGEDVLVLIERAEDHLANGGYSVRRYRQDLIDDGFLPPEDEADTATNAALDARAAALREQLMRLAKFEDDTLMRAAQLYAGDTAFVEALSDCELLLAALRERVGRAVVEEEVIEDEEEVVA